MSQDDRPDIVKAEHPAASDFQPDERLASRLEWFQDLKFGFFMHWGAYCQWGCIESWPLVEEDTWARPDGLQCWEERGRDLERFRREYWDLNQTFNPVKFDPAPWAAAAKRAGMKYVVFTTKHHDGFSMFDTKQTNYRITAPECPFHKTGIDITKAVFDAFREEGFGIGVYFSKSDWHHPDYWDPTRPAPDRNPNYNTHEEPEKWAGFVEFVHGQIEELMAGYGPVDILWLDGGQVRPPNQDIQMDRLAEMARSHQPDLIIADRTVGGPHENYLTPEQEVPEQPLGRAWESCLTMGDGWSYRPDDRYKSAPKLIHLLVDVVAKGGNLLLNVGPSPEGELAPVALDRLREIGGWMSVNAEAIHGTRAVEPYRTGDFAFTRKGDSIYAIYLPEDGDLVLPATLAVPALHPAEGSGVQILGVAEPLAWEAVEDGISIDIPERVRQALPCQHAVVFRMEKA